MEVMLILAFNFASDLSGGVEFGHLNLIKHGSMGLHLKFESSPPLTITAFIHAEFDNLIQIDNDGNVATDYM